MEYCNVIPTRTPNQIRLHSQKFYKRLKECKDTELVIDFTSRHIKNVNDMIAHIKSVNKDYNIVTVFLYLSEKCYPDKNPKKTNKIDNININNILREDINIDNNSTDSDLNNNIQANIAKNEVAMSNKIINNNCNNSPINNVLINNINYYNYLLPLIQFNLNNSNTSINNNMSFQNITFNTKNIMRNYDDLKNLSDKNNIFNYPIYNFELIGVNNVKDHCE